MSSPRFFPAHPRARLICLGIGAFALLVLLIRTGWAAEDSYISFRVVQNFLSGYGLTWNPGERVQVYTDPLFVFLVTAGTWISGSVYWSSVVISLLLTMGAYFLIMDRRPIEAILIGTAILLSSKSFMDFSVSGLENPATHLGIVAFCWTYWRKRDPLLLTLIASLTAVNRLDSLLLFLPALLFVYYREGWKAWKPALLGATPLIAWEAFSLFYYGFPFPNTAYAKLATGISPQALKIQGFLYLKNGLEWDKITACVIVAGFIVSIWVDEWVIAIGLFASIAYVIRVGGDFMSGRFLSAPFVLACMVLIHYLRLGRKTAIGLSAAILLATFLNLRPTLTTTANFGIGDAGPLIIDGIADERLFFYPATGILRWKPGIQWPDHIWSNIGDQYRKSGPRVVPVKTAGVVPYHAGPGVYVIDEGGLGDALLARLPTGEGLSRIGHYFRKLPSGYFETIETGVNKIQDPGIAEYYTHLHNIISGDLLRRRRLTDIVAINLGRYESLLHR
jgi:arabinofuranosyltransferase